MVGGDKILTIDLLQSSDTKEFEGNNIIHKEEYDRAMCLINRKIKRAKEYTFGDKKDWGRYNDTISILGSRGSGKTSFLRSLLKRYKEDTSDNSVVVLDIIDPTLIEEKGHVFLTIISLIRERVEQIFDSSACTPNDAKYLTRKGWEERLRKLACGLPSMDGVGTTLEYPDWQDAEYIMNKGLKSVKSAYDLERNFNELLAFSLKILDKKAFIIALDDIDVDFLKGWPVLETIRKYLTSPQLIILLSGDLKLYSKAIRKQQWKNFGKALLINEGQLSHRINGYNDLVTEMESQYMQKVIKPENRIRLTTLLEKINGDNVDITIKGNGSAGIGIREYYDNELKKFGINNAYQAESYRSFLMSQPIRTQIQFLEGLKNDIVIEAFLNDLYEKGVDVDLARNIPKMLNVLILKLLLQERALSDAYQLQPTALDASLNSSVIAFSFLFSQNVKTNSFLIFDYFIKIGYVRNILLSLGFADHARNAISVSKPSIEGLCNYSGVFQDKVLRDVVGNMTAYIESSLKNSETQNGNVYLYGFASKQKGSSEESKGKIDYELANKSLLIQRLAFIPLVISQDLTNNTSIISFSIYSLLASISELIKKLNFNDMVRGVMELSQIRSYPMYAFDKSIANISDVNTYDGFEFTENGNCDLLIHLFEYWCLSFPEEQFSPHVLGKISTKIYYAMVSIQSETSVDVNYAEAIHRRIVAVMNAILVEDVREHVPNCDYLNINNAITSDRIFATNLKQVMQNMGENNFSLSRWLLGCPLFLFYLSRELLDNSDLKKYVFPKTEEEKLKNKMKAKDMEAVKMNEFLGYNTNVDKIFEKIKEAGVYAAFESIYVKPLKGFDYSSRPRFASGNIRVVINVLKKNDISLNEFCNMKFDDFKSKCSGLFSNEIKINSYRSIQDKLKGNNNLW